MNNKLLIIALVSASIALTTVVNAQTKLLPLNADPVRVSIELKSILGIEINRAVSVGEQVVMRFNTKDDYVTQLGLNAFRTTGGGYAPKQLKAFCTGDYSLNLKATGDLEGDDGKDRISLDALSVLVRQNGMEDGWYITPTTAVASIIDKVLKGTSFFDVSYKVSDPRFLLGKTKQVYSTTFIYSISAL